jgi:thioredoxin
MNAIENIEQFNALVKGDKPVMLDFYADWCGPCRTLLPTVEKLADEYNDRVDIYKVNVDAQAQLAQHFKVRSIPALFFIKDGEVIDRAGGVLPENMLREKLDNLAEKAA